MQQDIMDYLMASSPCWDSRRAMRRAQDAISSLGLISKLRYADHKQHEAGNECALLFLISPRPKVLILHARRAQFCVSLWWFTWRSTQHTKEEDPQGQVMRAALLCVFCSRLSAARPPIVYACVRTHYASARISRPLRAHFKECRGDSARLIKILVWRIKLYSCNRVLLWISFLVWGTTLLLRIYLSSVNWYHVFLCGSNWNENIFWFSMQISI